MQNSPFSLSNENLEGTIIASKASFEEEAVRTALGKYTPNYYISFVPCNESDLKITISCKKSNSLHINFLKEIMNELLDQQIRLDLQNKFGHLRESIVKHAFEPVRL